MPVRIMIGADLVPTKSNYGLFESGDKKALVGEEILPRLNAADFTIFNLEVPLADKGEPITKCGPNLIAPTATIKGLNAINSYFFGLANNHILDQGFQGLKSTIETLNKAGISHAGAGDNLKDASEPFITEINGIKIGIYCCAEHEFTIASESTPGANPFDPLESLDHVHNLKAGVDYVIVLYHGGKEHYRYPSPHLQKVCRKLVDKGADLVVCQHNHCIGAAEEWNEGRIVYGQGNFLFDNSESEFWQTSLLIDLMLAKEGDRILSSVNYIPLRKHNETVRLAKEEDAGQILKDFRSRSEEIKDPVKVKKYYRKFADEMLDNYLYTISGKTNVVSRIINRLSGYKHYKSVVYKKYNKKSLAALRNYTECEAHTELLIQGINDRLYFGGQR